MPWHPRTRFKDKWKITRSVNDRPCVHCGEIILREDLRVVFNPARHKCYHIECFKQAFANEPDLAEMNLETPNEKTD